MCHLLSMISAAERQASVTLPFDEGRKACTNKYSAFGYSPGAFILPYTIPYIITYKGGSNSIMAFTRSDKMNIAKRMADGKKSYTVAKELGISRSTLDYALKHDAELCELISEFQAELSEVKKKETERAINSLKDLYESRLDSLLATWQDLTDLTKEKIDETSIRDRVGAAKLILDMIMSLSQIAKDESEDDGATSIEIIVEDASVDE